jgi:3-methyl-2-oxobutanoate hydroxymethyltransferase
VQGRDVEGAEKIARQAHALAELGCFSLVLECIPAPLAARITRELTIPTIGIGAGPCTDGQVLVLQDLWGVAGDRVPRFVRRYIDGETMLTEALDRYDADVKGGQFPSAAESYS